jgi:hypothetical protein
MKTAHGIVHSSPLSPSPRYSGKFLGEVHRASRIAVLTANNIYEEKKKKKRRRRRSLSSSLAPTN